MHDSHVKRGFLAFGFWLIATLSAGSVALGAVYLAVSQATTSSVRPLTASEVNALPIGPQPDAGDTIGVVDATESAPDEPSEFDIADPLSSPVLEPADSSTPNQSTDTPASTDTGTAISSPPAEGAGNTTVTTAPATTTTTSQPGDQQTFALVGGSVSVIFSDGSLELAWARPNSGFQMDDTEVASSALKVTFESDSHKSELKIEWADGAWDIRQEETDDGIDDDD